MAELLPVDPMQALRHFAEGRITHRFDYCPDYETPGLRVTGCPVCEALDATAPPEPRYRPTDDAEAENAIALAVMTRANTHVLLSIRHGIAADAIRWMREHRMAMNTEAHRIYEPGDTVWTADDADNVQEYLVAEDGRPVRRRPPSITTLLEEVDGHA